jgi:hypothetical protein
MYHYYFFLIPVICELVVITLVKSFLLDLINKGIMRWQFVYLLEVLDFSTDYE